MTKMDMAPVQDTLTKLARLRNEVIATQAPGEAYDEACDALLKPLKVLANGTTFYALQLPQCFPSMTQPDRLTILEWHVKEGDIVRPGHDLLEVRANYGDIMIPTHPRMRGSYRVMQLLKATNESLHMGDLLLILQDVTSRTSQRRRKSKRSAVAA